MCNLGHVPKSSPYLTAAQVAETLKVDRRTVTRWAESGRLTVALRLPGETGALLFDPEVVASFDPRDPDPVVAASTDGAA